MRSAKLFEQEGGGTRPRRDEQERRPRGRNADWYVLDLQHNVCLTAAGQDHDQSKYSHCNARRSN